MWDSLDMSKIENKFDRIDWKFIAPMSPHQGGFYERMVGSVKKALISVLPRGEVTDEELYTAFCTIEGLLNNRPLGPLISNDLNDPETLTPGHFLIGSKYQDIAVNIDSWPPKRRWHAIQTLLDSFWSRFVKEIVPQFHKMNKWVRPQPNFQVGDVVLVLDERIRGIWPLARVIEVYTDHRDQIVRTVMITRQGKNYTRSVHKLALLDAVILD
jgi:hypothetical protein